ncbi:hypothetical protein PRIPAC_86994 [Pristionchus pacificus]|uniref:Uncharacterized protein n=1 Tax=Pristionchus pacificus TaxID=54126 RepID=A0A2A6BKH4_PRIPA|nr:hypothetical protein PRIPAC_86994 [Pristionchus pacificus]|eukprot:PDM66415.1 hypothetical protein PRIPAC_47832 [Pristionchus pacificus]
MTSKDHDYGPAKKRDAINSNDSASKQPIETLAMVERRERLSKKRKIFMDSDNAESAEEQQTKKGMRVGKGNERQESASEPPPSADPPSADAEKPREEFAKANDVFEV